MPRPILLTALLALACGAVLGVVASTLLGGDPIRFEPAASQPAAAAPSLDPILERLERLEAALRELRLAALSAPSSAAGQLSPPPAETASARVPVAAPSTDKQLEERLASIEAVLEALRLAVAESTPPAKIPSLQQLRSAPVQNFAALQQLRSMEETAAKASVQWLSQEEILQTYGRPSGINAKFGTWWYDTGTGRSNVMFTFTEDYVVDFQFN